jgi:hypothetical protein
MPVRLSWIRLIFHRHPLSQAMPGLLELSTPQQSTNVRSAHARAFAPSGGIVR